ncbi:MAG: hypothetical protein ACI89L_001491 [Phycisphaerales bacterium]|jgi:hypothetical protein
MSRTHVILVTHTADRLRRTLLGVACQSKAPDTVVVSCDSDHPSIRDAVQAACNEFGLTVRLILRAKCEHARAAQVRNNGVRELLAHGAQPGDAVIYLDGDCVPERDLAKKHAAALRKGQMVLGGRYEMTPDQDAAFDETALRQGNLPITPTPEQGQALASRRARLVRQARLRRFGLARLGLVKPHKPKLLVGASSFTLEALCAVNGMDETYVQWGQEDDDLARRIYQWGGKPVVVVGDVHTFHQYHTTRAPGDWHQSPNAKRLAEPAPTRCELGIDNPMPQPEPMAQVLVPGAGSAARPAAAQ